MRFVFTGGGTGGHIYPALAVIGALKEMEPESEILFVGTARGLEADIVPRAGIPFKTVRALGLRGKSPLNLMRGLYQAALGVKDARRLLEAYGPRVVVGTGGYASGPVVLAARLMGIPTLLQEQNVVPGITNRLLGPFSSMVFLPYEECRKYFARRTRTMITGNPVRQELFGVDRTEAALSLNLDPDLKTLLILGGSVGARAVLETALKGIPRLPEGQWQALVITGASYLAKAKGMAAAVDSDWWSRHTALVPYVYQMEKALGVSDLVVARAGAMTIAEITALGLPSILVPSPNVVGDHQTINARMLEAKGATRVLREDALSPQVLADNLASLMKDEEGLDFLGRRAKSLGRPDAAKRIAHVVLGKV